MRPLHLLDQNKLGIWDRQWRRPYETRFKVQSLASPVALGKINYLESQLPYLMECQTKRFVVEI